MSVAVITGAAGLIGSEAVRHFAEIGLEICGIDNDMRRVFFGPEASTAWMRDRLVRELSSYTHSDLDIRDERAIKQLFARYGREIRLSSMQPRNLRTTGPHAIPGRISA